MRCLLALATLHVVLTTTSCVSQRADDGIPKRTDPSPAPPRPPGIALDVPEELPKARPSANAEQSVVVLQTPRSRSLALDLVAKLFEALGRDDAAGIVELLTQDAQQISSTGQQGSQAAAFWTRRLEHVSYADLSGHLIYDRARVACYTAAELLALGRANRVHLSPKPDELLLVVPIIEPGSSPRRLGDVLELVLAPVKDGYKIHAIYEDFSLP